MILTLFPHRTAVVQPEGMMLSKWRGERETGKIPQAQGEGRKSPGGGREGQMKKTIPVVLVLVEDNKKGTGRRSRIVRKEVKGQRPTVKVRPNLEKP